MRGLRRTIAGLLVAACCLAGCSERPTTTAVSAQPSTASPAPSMASPSPPASPAAVFSPGRPCKHAGVSNDFNGDGRSDLVAITTDTTDESDEVEDATDAVVLYRTPGGFSEKHTESIGTADDGAPPIAGFLDADCYADVATLLGKKTVVMHGSPSGLMFDSAEVLGNSAIAMPGYHVEAPYAIGDFNGDGRDDLGLAADRGLGTLVNRLCIMYGSPTGLRPAQHCMTISGGLVQTSTAVGDITGDHIDDLAIGDSFTKLGNDSFAGSVQILYGSRHGLTATGRQVLNATGAGVLAPPPRPAGFGSVVALGDITGDGHDDLVVGTAGSVNGDTGRSTVAVYRGARSGVTRADRQLFTVASPGMPGPGSPQGKFGFSVTVGDFNGDGHADVAIGRPGLSVGGVAQAGMVYVLSGTAAGLTTRGARTLTARESGIVLTRSDYRPQFGQALTTLPSIHGRTDDLIVGAAHRIDDQPIGASWIVDVPGSRTGLRAGRAGRISSGQLKADSIGAQFGR